MMPPAKRQPIDTMAIGSEAAASNWAFFCRRRAVSLTDARRAFTRSCSGVLKSVLLACRIERVGASVRCAPFGGAPGRRRRGCGGPAESPAGGGSPPARW
ncbi:hypothetical protein GCM10009787_27900 [Streptomyces bangladeshensis]|uniref:Uncharacterized protein n=1 Tax=Streptomyces bangladeshensis TaxID=295352 RepID=A0ABP5N904_9ACTN